MSKFRELKIILGNIKGLFIIMAMIMIVMAGMCFLLGEISNSIAFIYGSIISISIGIILWIAFPSPEEPELKHAMVIAALAYLLVPAISVVPLIMIQHMSPLDAFFETMSGWTGSGFTMIPDPQDCSKMVILWRSVMQWIGGIGVIVLMVSILIRPGTSTFILYQSEARKDRIHPSIQSTVRTIWGLYVILTIVGVFLLYFAGMPLWDSLNHAMVGIGTGGFSIYPDSIAAYDNAMIEIAIIPLMIWGALPFIVIYKAIREGKWELYKDIQVKAFLLLIIVGAAFLILENYFVYDNFIESARYSIFQFVSAITCTGFQTSSMQGWTPTALLILSIAMIIGGCAGSTAGGIKVARAIFLGNEIKLWFKKTLLPKNAIITIKIGDRRLTEDVVNKELAEATLISFLWIITILLGVMSLSHVLGPSYDISKIIFEVCSAQGNVGLSCGIVNQSLHYIGKIVLILNMWVGRLEIIPVTLLLRSLLKGFKV